MGKKEGRNGNEVGDRKPRKGGKGGSKRGKRKQGGRKQKTYRSTPPQPPQPRIIDVVEHVREKLSVDEVVDVGIGSSDVKFREGEHEDTLELRVWSCMSALC